MRKGNAPVVLLVSALAGCVTPPPVAEVRLVAKAFDNLNAASQPLLDDLAVAERRQGRVAAEQQARARAEASGELKGPCAQVLAMGGDSRPLVLSGFCPDDSSYYVELTDPPATRAFRRALTAVGDYTQLLLILAEGRNVDEAKGQLQTLTGNPGTALGAAGLPQAGPVLQGLLQALDPVLGQAAQVNDARELQRLVLQESPKVEQLVLALKNASPELFNTLAEAPLAGFNLAPKNRPEVADQAAKQIEAVRVSVSGYVVLLDQYRELLDALVRVYDRPWGASGLAGLAQQSAQLSAQAEAWRRSLALLRAGVR
jgi:hypothetical protein